MDELRASVRRAYERARIRQALPWAVPGLLLAGLGALANGPSVLPVGVVLTLSLVVMHWLGNGWDAGLRLGLQLGAVSFLALSGWALVFGACGSTCSSRCELFCLAVGAGAGASLARVAWIGETKQATGATWLTAWSAGLACLPLGWSGLVMVLVVVGVSSPVIVGASLRRA
ncbi:MAG: hypothetical protein AAF602_26090 [Myxococcota bacterium]